MSKIAACSSVREKSIDALPACELNGC